ncbi:MAG: hypothetical protein PHY30_03230 [Candidatus Pacebacteria bacterium]|nr:hypothetical protein [Candidatus Paceibacterota bacterium]
MEKEMELSVTFVYVKISPMNFIEKQFDDWNKKKKQLNRKKSCIYCKNREIWWASMGFNIGREMAGKNSNFERPILILKKISKDTLFILPFTSKKKVGSLL